MRGQGKERRPAGAQRPKTATVMVAEYLAKLASTKGTGEAVAETSYYGSLQQLLNHVGQSLQPRIFANQHPRNRGAGIADMGLFSAEQIQSASAGPWQLQVPSRGVVEVKGPTDDLGEVAELPQVVRYAKKYGQVLITNLRAFNVVTFDTQGKIHVREPFELASSESTFWRLVDNPQAIDTGVAQDLETYLRDALSRPAPITSPEHLAWFLASYARLALQKVEQQGLGELAPVRQDLQHALGITYTGERAEHFFRSTLVQTLFYGVFSVWVLWNRDREVSDSSTFDWRLAGWELDVPVIAGLFDRVAQPSGIQRLKLAELLDLAGHALNRANREKFFDQFEVDHAIEFFYEPFWPLLTPNCARSWVFGTRPLKLFNTWSAESTTSYAAISV